MMVIMLALVLLFTPFFLLGGPCKAIFFYIWRPLVRPIFFYLAAPCKALFLLQVLCKALFFTCRPLGDKVTTNKTT